MSEDEIRALIEELRNLKGDELYLASIGLPMKILVDVLNEMYGTMDEADPLTRDHMVLLRQGSALLTESVDTIQAVIDGYFEENPDPNLN